MHQLMVNLVFDFGTLTEIRYSYTAIVISCTEPTSEVRSDQVLFMLTISPHTVTKTPKIVFRKRWSWVYVLTKSYVAYSMKILSSCVSALIIKATG